MIKPVNVTLIALVSIISATLFAVWYVPEDVAPQGALFAPAMIMAIGLLLPVVLQIRRNLLSILRVQNLLMVGIIYWLLLDMLQSAYPFSSVAAHDVRVAFACVGLFAAGIWVGASGRAWKLPKVIQRVASRPIEPKAAHFAIWLAFALGMAKFVISSKFDIVLMIESLGNSRWNAPWARGDMGGYDAFLDHMQYFGYILPSLGVVLAVRVGWTDWRVIICLILSSIVIAFLAQSGGRRIIGVIWRMRWRFGSDAANHFAVGHARCHAWPRFCH